MNLPHEFATSEILLWTSVKRRRRRKEFTFRLKTEGSKYYVSTRVLSKADGPSLKREIEWMKEWCLNENVS